MRASVLRFPFLAISGLRFSGPRCRVDRVPLAGYAGSGDIFPGSDVSDVRRDQLRLPSLLHLLLLPLSRPPHIPLIHSQKIVLVFAYFFFKSK